MASSLTTVAVIVGVGALVMPAWQANVSLDRQMIQVKLPEGAPVTVEITEPIDTDLNAVLDVEFPIDEVLPLKFEAPLQMDIEIDTELSLQTVIRYEGTLPLEADVTARIFGVPVNVPVSGNIPLKLYVPVDQSIPLKFKAPVKVSMQEALQVPIKLDFKTSIPINQSLKIPVNKPLETNIQMSDRPLVIELTGSDMVVPLDSLRLTPKPDH